MRLDPRPGRRLLLVLAGGLPHRGHSQVSGIAASVAKLGRVSCLFAHPNDARDTRRGLAALGHPMGPAPTLLPRMALPLLTDHPLKTKL